MNAARNVRRGSHRTRKQGAFMTGGQRWAEHVLKWSDTRDTHRVRQECAPWLARPDELLGLRTCLQSSRSPLARSRRTPRHFQKARLSGMRPSLNGGSRDATTAAVYAQYAPVRGRAAGALSLIPTFLKSDSSIPAESARAPPSRRLFGDLGDHFLSCPGQIDNIEGCEK